MSLDRTVRLTSALAVGLLVLAAPMRPGHAQSVEDFYRGRTVTLTIGFSAGGGYDLYARLLARHLGKHIPGQPNVLPQNREGAGSQRATLYLYNAAPKDGSVIGTFSRSMVVAPLLADAPFDATRLSWIGSISSDVSTCMTWKTSPIKTFDDMLAKLNCADEATFSGKAWKISHWQDTGYRLQVTRRSDGASLTCLIDYSGVRHP